MLRALQQRFFPQRNRYSLEQLEFYFQTLSKHPNITDANQSLVIETLRSLAELVIWGDQHSPEFFEYFLEKNMLKFFMRILNQKTAPGMKVQVLQTLSILIENIQSETSIYYLMSNNHINEIIVHKFDFSDEDVLAYYISFLKTLSLKLNNDTVQFFFNERGRDFPLYTEAVKFFNHEEAMIRIAVRTLTLNIYKLENHAMRKFILDSNEVPYFSNLVNFVGRLCQSLDETLLHPDTTHLNHAKLDHYIDEVVHHLYYVNDIFNLNIDALNDQLASHLLQDLFIPVFVKSIMPRPEDLDQEVRLTPLCALFLIGHVFTIFTNRALVNCLATLLIHPNPPLADLASIPNLVLSYRQASNRDFSVVEKDNATKTRKGAPSDDQASTTNTFVSVSENPHYDGEGDAMGMSSSDEDRKRMVAASALGGLMAKPPSSLTLANTANEATPPPSPAPKEVASAGASNVDRFGLRSDNGNPRRDTLMAYLTLSGSSNDDSLVLPTLFCLNAVMKNQGVERELLELADMMPQRLRKSRRLLDALTGLLDDDSEITETARRHQRTPSAVTANTEPSSKSRPVSVGNVNSSALATSIISLRNKSVEISAGSFDPLGLTSPVRESDDDIDEYARRKKMRGSIAGRPARKVAVGMSTPESSAPTSTAATPKTGVTTTAGTPTALESMRSPTAPNELESSTVSAIEPALEVSVTMDNTLDVLASGTTHPDTVTTPARPFVPNTPTVQSSTPDLSVNVPRSTTPSGKLAAAAMEADGFHTPLADAPQSSGGVSDGATVGTPTPAPSGDSESAPSTPAAGTPTQERLAVSTNDAPPSDVEALGPATSTADAASSDSAAAPPSSGRARTGTVQHRPAESQELLMDVSSDDEDETSPEEPGKDEVSLTSLTHSVRKGYQKPTQARGQYSAALAEKLIFVLHYPQKCRVVSLQLCGWMLMDLVFVKGTLVKLSDEHSQLLTDARRVAVRQMKEFFITVRPDVLLSAFESGYKLFRPLSPESLTSDGSMLLPVTNLASSNLPLGKRMASGENESVQRATMIFLAFREIEAQMRGVEAEKLAWAEGPSIMMSKGEKMDVAGKQLMPCTVMEKTTPLPRWIYVDMRLASGRLVLLEPDPSKPGTGTVRFHAPLQTVELEVDKTNASVLNAQGPPTAASVAKGKPVPAWTLQLIFEENACIAAKDHIEQARVEMRELKVAKIRELLEASDEAA